MGGGDLNLVVIVILVRAVCLGIAARAAPRGDRSRKAPFTIKVEDSPTRQNMVFYGASILAGAHEVSHPWWITKQEYMESGAGVVGRLVAHFNIARLILLRRRGRVQKSISHKVSCKIGC